MYFFMRERFELQDKKIETEKQTCSGYILKINSWICFSQLQTTQIKSTQHKRAMHVTITPNNTDHMEKTSF
jgi:carbohydrate-binding DOMON domain-containing protein